MLKEKRTRPRPGKALLPGDRELSPIPFDRRAGRRQPAEGTLMAAFVSDETGITLARVHLRDSSRVGVCLRCPLPVEPGTRFTLYREGIALAADRGTVARCAERDGHYLLGLRFDLKPAA